MSSPVAVSISPAPPAHDPPPSATAPHPAAAAVTPGCPQCEQLSAERNRYRTALTEMACSVGWPLDREAHLKELQQLAHQTLGMSWDRANRDPTPPLARLAYGKQPGARPRRREPNTAAWLRITRPMRVFRGLLKHLG